MQENLYRDYLPESAEDVISRRLATAMYMPPPRSGTGPVLRFEMGIHRALRGSGQRSGHCRDGLDRPLAHVVTHTTVIPAWIPGIEG
jgi:hypothetical protein